MLLHLLHSGGTLASCQRATIQHDGAALTKLQLSHAQQDMAAERQQKLRSMEL